MSNSSDDDSSVVSSSSDSTSASPRNNKRPRIQQAPLQNAAAAEKPLGIEDKKKRVIVLLDQARLETVKTKKGDFQLLNCDDHRDLCRKYKKNPADYITKNLPAVNISQKLSTSTKYFAGMRDFPPVKSRKI